MRGKDEIETPRLHFDEVEHGAGEQRAARRAQQDGERVELQALVVLALVVEAHAVFDRPPGPRRAAMRSAIPSAPLRSAATRICWPRWW